MLTARLKGLVDNGILEKRPYQEKPVRHEYVQTDFGRSHRPVLVAMAAWRNSQLSPEQRAMILMDSETGREVEPAVIDLVTGLGRSPVCIFLRSRSRAGDTGAVRRIPGTVKRQCGGIPRISL
ncbi:helix-turn-helix domain-containing protein [Arthrobacter sp. ZGTC212]|uniref:winged helix-turn-helix transcriptional regulator n=1 Tax=Arthrobacter sp. ZGTC212 TaxID=2058899 RepID=UPI001C67D45A|nr:helix-turn-helix domain-containing protein [Arthrobacter sp. ZGTC212]